MEVLSSFLHHFYTTSSSNINIKRGIIKCITWFSAVWVTKKDCLQEVFIKMLNLSVSRKAGFESIAVLYENINFKITLMMYKIISSLTTVAGSWGERNKAFSRQFHEQCCWLHQHSTKMPLHCTFTDIFHKSKAQFFF